MHILLSLGLLISIFAGVDSVQASVNISKVGCPNIPVSSLEQSVSFFTSVLDFKSVGKEDTSDVARLAPGMPMNAKARSAHLTLGGECLDLTEYKFPKGSSFPSDSHGNDHWFQHVAIVVSDMDKAYVRLRDAHVRFVSNVPQTLPEWNKNAAGISAFYFRDPDGHYLELIHFPAGKGQSKWQNQSPTLFLGIDHTAITVSNTSQSLAFYRDLLHLHVAGGSENYGVEQEHLSGVFNAHVIITSLRSDSGIGVEFLDYLSPTFGRLTPSDRRISDLSNWQLPLEVVETPDTQGPKIIWKKLPLIFHDYSAIAWMKDPDGHLLKLIKRR